MKRFLSILMSAGIVLGMIVSPVFAETDGVIGEVHIVPGQGNNCIVIESDEYDDFNIYKKSDNGNLSLIELPNAKDYNGNYVSDDKWEYCDRRLYLDEDVVNGTEYTYLVKAVDENGAEAGDGIEVSGTPFSTPFNETKFKVGSYWNYWNASNHSYGYVTEKDGVGVGGSRGLYISKMGENDANNGFTSVTYDFGTVLQSGKVYKFVWKQKLTKCNWAGGDGLRVQAQSSTDGKTWNGATYVPFTDSEKDGQWYTKTMYVKGTGQSSIEFYVLKTSCDLVFDNFELYEVNSQTLENVSSSNILAFCNPTFDVSEENVKVIGTSYFAESEIKIDGVANEQNWHMAKDFIWYGSSVGKIGFLWNGKYAYFALDSQSADSLVLTLGNKTFEYKIKEGIFSDETNGAIGKTSGSISEIAIPFEECGIVPGATTRTENFSASVKSGDKIIDLGTDELTFVFSSLIYRENMDNFPVAGFAQGTSWANTGSTINDVIFKQSESFPGAVNLYNKSTSQEVCKGWRYNYGSVITGAYDLEFTVNFEDLPVLSTKDKAWQGFVFELNTDKRHRFSFTSDENGNVLLNTLYWLSGQVLPARLLQRKQE